MQSGSGDRVVFAVMFLTLGLALGGCCSPEMKPYDVTVSLSPTFGANKPAIEVHLVGVNEPDQSMWSDVSMSRYWQEPNNKLRTSANTYVMNFGQGRPDTQTLKKTDPIWQKWSGATRLYVLAFLPGSFPDGAGDRDPRRRILPLNKCQWPQKEEQQIKITLLPSNIMVETPPLPEKK
jgi:hypothetical protein